MIQVTKEQFDSTTHNWVMHIKLKKDNFIHYYIGEEMVGMKDQIKDVYYLKEEFLSEP